MIKPAQKEKIIMGKMQTTREICLLTPTMAMAQLPTMLPG